MRKRNFRIGEVAKITGIPTSTLRYWEEEGLIRSARDEHNEYRKYSIKSVIDILEIAFYRELRIPIEELRDISNLELNDLEDIFLKTEEQVNCEIAALVQIKESIMVRRDRINTVRRLIAQPYQFSRPCFDKAIPDSLFDLPNPHDPVQNFPQAGIFFSQFKGTQPEFFLGGGRTETHENAIWEMSPRKKYIECLLKITIDNPQDSNLKEIQQQIIIMGYQPEKLMGMYLITVFDGGRYEYYQSWVEVE